MSKPSAKKRKKQLDRAKKDTERARKYQDRKAAIDRFPEVVYETEGASDKFVDDVKITMKKVVAEHRSLFLPSFVEQLYRAREFGFSRVFQEIRVGFRRMGSEPINDDGVMLEELILFNAVGEVLVKQLELRGLTRELPYNSVAVSCGWPRDDTIFVRIRSLRSTKTDRGTAYYSAYTPKVQVAGQDKVVGFFRHAVDRVIKRIVGSDLTNHALLVGAQHYFFDCVYYEPCQLIGHDKKEELGLVLYCRCEKGFDAYAYAERLLGELERDRRYYCRIGYCPAEVFGGFVVAKTLLVPGMRGTPEYHRVVRRFPFAERTAVWKRLETQRFDDAAHPVDFDLFKSFHESGVPQIVSFDHEVFRPMAVLGRQRTEIST